MEPVNRTSENLRDLIAELDTKLMRGTRAEAVEPSTARSPQRTYTRGVPTLVAALSILLIAVGVATVIVRPWRDQCTFDAALCYVETLDIDALRVTVPDSALLAELPNIDALDPDDVLTVGEIFKMERFQHLNLAELLSPEEIDVLLAPVE